MDDLRNSFYKFYTWLSISGNNVTANQLNAPRVRTAPSTPALDDMQIENSKFSEIELLNLPYQELSHSYQYKNFFQILYDCSDSKFSDLRKSSMEVEGKSSKGLVNEGMAGGEETAAETQAATNPNQLTTSTNKGKSKVKMLHLQGNKLKSLSRIKFLKVEEAYLQHNLFSNFTDLPTFSDKLQTLDISDNNISKLDKIKFCLPKNLISLNLARNPICFIAEYRRKVFESLPNLVYLDGIPKLLEDESEKDGQRGVKRNASIASIDVGYYS